MALVQAILHRGAQHVVIVELERSTQQRHVREIEHGVRQRHRIGQDAAGLVRRNLVFWNHDENLERRRHGESHGANILATPGGSNQAAQNLGRDVVGMSLEAHRVVENDVARGFVAAGEQVTQRNAGRDRGSR